jgi:hypothetical protein
MPPGVLSVLLFLLDVLYIVMLASFRGDNGAAVLARNAIVGTFHLHRPVTQGPVRGRDFPVRQPTLGQGV